MVTQGSEPDFSGGNDCNSSSSSCTSSQQDSLSMGPPNNCLPMSSQSIVPRIPFLPADHLNPYYGHRFDIKENVDAWRPYGPVYDPTILAHHPMLRNGYGYGFDLNGNRRKNATRETTSTLKAWLNDHRKNPYPTKAEKIMLAIITQMTLTQVSTWFANARRRLKKENKMTWSPRNRCDDDDEDCKEDAQEDSDSDIDINDNDDCPSSNKRFKRSTSPLFDSTSAVVPTPHHLSQHHFYPFIQHHHLLSLNDHHHQQQQQQQQQQTPQQQQQQNQHPQQQQQAPSLNDPATSSENKVSSPSRIWSIVETAMTTKSNT